MDRRGVVLSFDFGHEAHYIVPRAMVKRCKDCGEEKPRDEFYVNKKGHLEPYCKPCRRARTLARNSDPAKREATREYARNRCKKARQEERRAIAEKAGRAYMTREERALAAKEAKAERDRRITEEREARKRERDAKRAADIAAHPWKDPSLSCAQRFAMRYQMDPEFNAKVRLRAHLRRKRQGVRLAKVVRAAARVSRSSSTLEAILGYSVTDLRSHLERQFTRGMTWARFCKGEIHIDHIVPLSSFDCSDAEELRSAFALTNLRPLWAKENVRKASRRELLC